MTSLPTDVAIPPTNRRCANADGWGRSTANGADLDCAETAFRPDYWSESRIVVARLCGSFDTAGAWQRLEAIGKEVTCRAVEGVLLDVRQSTYTPDPADAHAFAVYLISFLGRRRLAFITRSVVQYGMARMIAADAAVHGVSVKVFQGKQAAEAWLRSTDTR
jgi:hypothetical protein